MPKRKETKIGEKYGLLTIAGLAFYRIDKTNQVSYWVDAQCDCGNKITVSESKVRTGHTKSCGCLKKTSCIRNLPAAGHGMTGSPTYISWQAMHYRCYNPQCNGFNNYGGRGIVVCERWKTFDNFLTDMGKRPDGQTLDRINSNGNYEPSNCKWSTWREQEGNRRDNRMIILAGDTICFAEAARLLGVGVDRLKYQSKILGGDQLAVNSILKEILTAAA